MPAGASAGEGGGAQPGPGPLDLVHVLEVGEVERDRPLGAAFLALKIEAVVGLARGALAEGLKLDVESLCAAWTLEPQDDAVLARHVAEVAGDRLLAGRHVSVENRQEMVHHGDLERRDFEAMALLGERLEALDG